MEQLDIFGKFIPTEKDGKPSTPRKSKIVLRYKASFMDIDHHWYKVSGAVSPKQARFFLYQEMCNSGYPNPKFVFGSHKVIIETYTIKL